MPASTCTTGSAAVIGGGIAGLSAAVALRRAGWKVQVFEKSQFKNEIGAAISVPPNATRVLDRWGFDMKKARPVPNQTMRLALAHDLSYILDERYPDLVEEVGHESWSFHRVDLHRGLTKLAQDAARSDGQGWPVEMNLRCEVASVDCDRGLLVLKDRDGTRARTVKKDLVVIADGAHSHLISDLTGRPSDLRRTGRSIYRWLVSMKDVLADPDIAQHYPPNQLPGFISFSDPTREILWVSYTCRGGTMLNNAVVHDTQSGEGNDSLWHSPVTKDQVLKMLGEGFHPTIQKLVNMADKEEDGIKVHHLFKRPPLDSFVRGRALVVGDAAHVMMPTHAAGGAIAIESAASLEVLFRGVNGGDEKTVKERLKLFDQLRLPRCNLTMLASNAGPRWLAVPGVEVEVRRFYKGPLPPAGTLPWTKEFRELLFHHDEFMAAEEALAAATTAVETTVQA